MKSPFLIAVFVIDFAVCGLIMFAAAVSDVVWQALIAAVVTCVLGYFQYRIKMSVDLATVKAGKVAATQHAAVEQVKETLAENTSQTEKKLNTQATVLGAVHTLVNSKFGVQLLMTANLARRLADITKDARDRKAAEEAEKIYQDHIDKQAKMDMATAATTNGLSPTPDTGTGPKTKETP